MTVFFAMLIGSFVFMAVLDMFTRLEKRQERKIVTHIGQVIPSDCLCASCQAWLE